MKFIDRIVMKAIKRNVNIKAENPYTHSSNSQQTRNFHPAYQDNINYQQGYEVAKGLNEGLALASNNVIGSGIVSTIVNEAIGNKLNCESSPNTGYFKGDITEEQAKEIQDIIESFFDTWQNDPNYCDYYHTSVLGTLERQMVSMAVAQGEIFAIIRIMRCGEIYLPQIQLISPLLVCSPNMTDTDKIIDGIEFDERGKEIAYYVKVIKPDMPQAFEWKRIAKYSRTGRVQMIHAKFNTIDPAQVRGRSLLAPLKDNLIKTDRYIEASIVKAEQQANIAYTIEKDKEVVESEGKTTLEELSGTSFEENSDNVLGQSERPIEADEPLTIKPGITMELKPGEHLHMTESNAPSQDFWNVIYAMSKINSSHAGVPAEKLYKSYVNSYSASQAAMQESHSNAVLWRNLICDSVLNVIYEQFVWCLASQELVSLKDFFTDNFARKAWCKVQWFGSAIIHNDPVKAVTAAILRINNNLSTYEVECRNLTGQSSDAVRKKVAEERKKIKELNPDFINPEINTEVVVDTTEEKENNE